VNDHEYFLTGIIRNLAGIKQECFFNSNYQQLNSNYQQLNSNYQQFNSN